MWYLGHVGFPSIVLKNSAEYRQTPPPTLAKPLEGRIPHKTILVCIFCNDFFNNVLVCGAANYVVRNNAGFEQEIEIPPPPWLHPNGRTCSSRTVQGVPTTGCEVLGMSDAQSRTQPAPKEILIVSIVTISNWPPLKSPLLVHA